MKLECQLQPEIGVFVVRSDISESDSDQLCQAINEYIAQGGRDIVIDLSEVDAIDSRCLETLLRLQEETEDRLGQFGIGGVSNTVDLVLLVTRLTSRFRLFGSSEEAIRQMKEVA